MVLTGDTGGSKTLLRVYDANVCVEEFKMQGFGAVLDSSDDIPLLSEKLSELKSKYTIDAIAFNLGGRNKGQIEKIIQRVFQKVPFKVFRESEGHAALSLASHYGCECALLAGTGTIAVAKHPKNRQVIIGGGWGCVLGDEGSGYHIGLSALQHAVQQVDLCGEIDLLASEILGSNKVISSADSGEKVCKSRDEIFKKLSPLSREHIASYTKLVGGCCAKGDAFSLKLMQNEGENMARIVENVLRKLRLDKVNGILITGGLISLKDYWQENFEKYLNERFDINTFRYIPDGIIRGTQLIANSLTEK